MNNKKTIRSSLIVIASTLIFACQASDEVSNNSVSSNKDSKENSSSTATTEADKVEQIPPQIAKKSKQEKRDITGLDLLTDYDRELWSGPDGWSDSQWQWKRWLNWGQECDYVADVKTFMLSKKLEFVSVLCVPGSYQPTYYLYLFDNQKKQGKQLGLGFSESSLDLNEVIGNIEYEPTNKQLSILTLSRGLADCGVYRVFSLTNVNSLIDSNLQIKQIRRRECEDFSGKDFDDLPKEIFDYKLWPVVREK